MKLIRRSIYSFFLSLLLFATAKSQKMPFQSFSIEQGLSESVAYDLLQDSKGYVWVATGYGLNRFDGSHFRAYYEDQGLADNKLYALFEDSRERLWIGTERGVSVLENDTLITPEQYSVLSSTSVKAVFEDAEGNFWFATDGNGIWKSEPGGTLFNITDQYGYRSVHGNSITQSPDGTIWIATEEGLMSILADQVRIFRERDGLPDVRIRDVKFDLNGDLWVATNNGLAVKSEEHFEVFSREHGLIDTRIQSITVTDENRLWLGTENGASLFDGAGFTSYTTEQGLSSTIIYSTMQDREGNIWLGTLGGGVNLFTGEIFHNYTVENGLTNNVVTGFEEDSEGNIWVATYGGGIQVYDGNEMTVFNESDGLADNIVFSFLEDSEGRMWIGTRSGINLYENGEIKPLQEFPSPTVRKIMETDGEFWIGTYNDGLIVFNGEVIEQFNNENGLLNNTVMDIKQDQDGNFWIATYGGVARYDGEVFRHYTVADGLPSNGVINIHIDHNDDKWFSTFNGLSKLDGERVISLSTSGQTETITYFMFQDYDLRYWVGTNRGLFQFIPERYFEAESRLERIKSFKLYNKNQGLVANELNAGASFIAGDRSVWLGTIEGLSRFYPEKIQANTTPPGLEIEQVLISGMDMTNEERVVLSYNQNLFEVSYTGLSFSSPGQLMYEYRMRGLDQGWQLTRDKVIRYPSLSPNEYEFELRAYNADGIRSDKTIRYAFIIHPPFYYQWWFIGLLIFLGVGMVLFSYRFFKVRKQVDIERMRVQIASDLHDDVGSSLTELALQTDFLQAGELNPEIKETLKELGEHSRKIVTSLDDIVWSIDSRNDTAGDLTDRMQDYVNHIFKNGQVEVIYHFEKLNMDEKLPVQIKENVYLIFKEAINNIVKHSDATRIEIFFSFQGKTYELLVRDNGTVKVEKSSRRTGQGLRNIQLRADRIQSRLEIQSDDGFSVHAKGSI
ncbi:MAG: two-component regulator propeller domain-containing protein [Balneolaceae bacterium]